MMSYYVEECTRKCRQHVGEDGIIIIQEIISLRQMIASIDCS